MPSGATRPRWRPAANWRPSTPCSLVAEHAHEARCAGDLAGGVDQVEHARGRALERRRLIVFTEYEDTRRWLERRLQRSASETQNAADERIGVFSGATGSDRREEVKRAFNADPDKEPMRILICTDAAREGINLQSHCADLVHFDLPWNPSRLEQRNGRIDRKLQPAKEVTCRYFRYEQREADMVLEALVRKTETIREELGSVGKVIEERIAKRLAEGGIGGHGAALAKAIADESDAERLARARAEMDDEERARHERLLKEQDDLRGRSSEFARAGRASSPTISARGRRALAARGARSRSRRGESVGEVDDLTASIPPIRLSQGSRLGRCVRRPAGTAAQAWRALQRVAQATRRFAPSPSNRRNLAMAATQPDVVQVHLEHRLVRGLLSRFLARAFKPSYRASRSFAGRARSRASS